jgi:DHA1 family multidrug resistance protein-like MFS transporter
MSQGGQPLGVRIIGRCAAVVPLYVAQLGKTDPAAIVQWSAVAFGATFFGTAITAPLWGRLADRHRRKPMLVRAAIAANSG